MGNYIETAKNIVKESIKSAVYIDEKAREPFEELIQAPTEEQTRSVELYNNFKKAGISLSIFKYQFNEYQEQKEYLFSGRDLVLLDWQLEGEGGGEKKALELLAEIVLNQKHIHFCSIYTSQNKDTVLKSILSYFSETSSEEYDEIKVSLSDAEEEIKGIESELNDLSFYRFDKGKRSDILNDIIKNHRPLTEKIKSQLSCSDLLFSLLKCGFAFNDNVKSPQKLPCPSSIDTERYVLIIQNTIILILNKKDNNPDTLINYLSNQIASYEWGIMQLLGLELQNKIRCEESFVTSDVLQVSKKALGYHKHCHPIDFENFLKNVWIEQNALYIRHKRLSLVEAIEDVEHPDNLDDEMAIMNVFYNSTTILHDKELSFGDVFRQGEDYFICITALCDCLRPEKIDNSFFFAKGSIIKKNTALQIGDTGFVSFLDKKTAVRWDCPSTNKDSTPAYIKPFNFFVPYNKIANKKLEVYNIEEKEGIMEAHRNDWEYITTIKQNYTQRIANQAFTYPTRVGVDFVKK